MRVAATLLMVGMVGIMMILVRWLFSSLPWLVDMTWVYLIIILGIRVASLWLVKGDKNGG